MMERQVEKNEFLCENVVVLIKNGGLWTEAEVNLIKLFLKGRYPKFIPAPAAYWDEEGVIVIDYATNNPMRRDFARFLVDRFRHKRFSVKFVPEENQRSFLKAKKISG